MHNQYQVNMKERPSLDGFVSVRYVQELLVQART